MIKRLNNKGFVFIETIIVSAFLMTALVLLYQSYSKVINSEEKKLYYDDISFVYRTVTIRDVFNRAVNQEAFDDAVNNNPMYIYFFNVNSPIFNSREELSAARDFFNFYQLAYIKIDDIQALKNCINKRGSYNATKCSNTITRIDSYANTNLKDYLKTLDVSYSEDAGVKSYEGHKGIMLSIFYFTKSGDKIDEDVINTSFGKYQECLDNKVYAFYAQYYYNRSEPYELTSDDEKKEVKGLYSKNSNLNFSMQCAYAYYYSWVYL